MIPSFNPRPSLGLPAVAMLALTCAAEASLLVLPSQAAGPAAFQPDCLKARGVATSESGAARFDAAASSRSGAPLLLAQNVVDFPACTYTPLTPSMAPEPALPIRGLW